MNIGDRVTLTFSLFQWRGQWVDGELKAVRTEVYPAGTSVKIIGGDGKYLYLENEKGVREDTTHGILNALTMKGFAESYPCRSCDTPTSHPWGVCPLCLRDPEVNECEKCHRHSPGIPYSYICGRCFSGQ